MNIGKGNLRGRERGEGFQKEGEDEVVVVEEKEEEEEESKFEGSDDENALPCIGALCHWET